MTAVIGTAGHIDHGKTALLLALTGIDADRLPEERRRGMTIEVGYAHLTLPDGREVDFVDVPGHDRLVGNMLVGAGEIDAALLVVAADDGPRAQTLEHLALLDGMGIADGLAVITKADLAGTGRLEEVRGLVVELLGGTGLAGLPVVAASAATGAGIDVLREAVAALATRLERRPWPGRGARLAVDRAFGVKGRGLVVTGSLRGGRLRAGDHLRLVPGGGTVRVRELQVHGREVVTASPGRTALGLGGADAGQVTRGAVLTADPGVAATDRLLVALEPPWVASPGRRSPGWPPRDGTRGRLHLGTDDVDAVVGRSGRDALQLADGRAIAMVRLPRATAAATGDRFVLRRPSPGSLVAGGIVLDPRPARGVSRRRQDLARLATLAKAVTSDDPHDVAAARLALHGALVEPDGAPHLDPALCETVAADVARLVQAWHDERPAEPGMPLSSVRREVTRLLRRAVTLTGDEAAATTDLIIAAAVSDGRLLREGDRVRTPRHQPAGPDPALIAAMDLLEAALVGNAPPPLAATAARVGCSAVGIRALERAGRIVILEPDLAWAAASYRELAARALVMATRAPLAPAAFRDATGTSRRYSLAILEDLDRRGILRRTDAGHVPGPKAPPMPGPTPAS